MVAKYSDGTSCRTETPDGPVISQGPVDAALHPSQQANPLVQTDNRRTLPARAASQCAMHHLDTTQTGSSANISKEAEIPEPARKQEEEAGRR